MAKLPLRKYNQEIESLIDQSHHDQAIAHARHILKYFPKCLSTYRLLGKAYLESQRYGDASDIFQRVLSALPDDFVSHVGMSIIREDEGNLEDATWHMERAFEIQPANGTIQAELRRLYGRRDGIEPPKVRLTRAALARMYLKGELYTQAIAELRSALSEDHERLDLLTMIAQAYHANGQKVEAADACNTLIKKAPYSYEANRILASILANSERASEVAVYEQRVHMLEPYAAHTSPQFPTSELAPESAIVVEKFVWSPGQSITGSLAQPEWAATLGVNLDEMQDQDKLPDWLAEVSRDQNVFTIEEPLAQASPIEQFSVVDNNEAILAPNPEDQIPDWMKEAGWKPSTGELAEPEREIETLDLFSDTELEPAQIPDWLQQIAPVEAGEGQPAESSLIGEIPPAKETIEAPEMPDWLAGAMAAVTPMAQGAEVSDEAEEAASLVSPDAGQPSPGAELPDWLHELAGETPASQVTISAAPEAPIDITPEISEAPVSLQPEPALDDTEAAFAWLESLAAKQGADEALFTKPEERQETPPEWVLKAAEQDSELETPEWLKEFEQPEISSQLPDQAHPLELETAQSPVAPGEQELPEWLRSESSWHVEEIGHEAPLDRAEALPDWLSAANEMETPSLPQAEPEEFIEEALVTGLSQALGEPAGAEDDLIASITPASDEALEPAELPDWLLELDQEETSIPLTTELESMAKEEPMPGMLFVPAIFAADQESQPTELAFEEPAIHTDDTKPTRVKAADSSIAEPALQITEQPIAQMDAFAEPATELPDWLQEISHEPAQVDLSQVTEKTQSSDEDAAFAWLESLAEKQGAEEALLLQPEDRVETPPEWIQQAVSEAQALEAAPEAEQLQTLPEPEAMDVTLKPEYQQAIGEQEFIEATTEPILHPVTDEVEELQQEITPRYEELPELPEWLSGVEEIQPATPETPWTPVLEPESIQMTPTLLDLNQAGLVELERLPGVGFIRASEILQYRDRQGRIETLDELLDVPGMDLTIIEQIRPFIDINALQPVAADVFVDQPQLSLIEARNSLIRGDIKQAAAAYEQIIRSNQYLAEVVQDLSDALYHHPGDVDIWVTLGDAHMRLDNLQGALDAYSKAEELLR
jgi:competence ComEA-like helix-hairpin-helix protein